VDAVVEALDVTMPQMGVSVTEGTVVEWRVQAGELVTADQTVCEISTDKIETEVPAPISGTLTEIIVAVGQPVPVGTVLAKIVPDGTPVEDARAPAHRSRSRSHSPVVRRVAEAHGVDLGKVTGSGRDGRVTKNDVLAFVAAAADTEEEKIELQDVRRALVDPHLDAGATRSLSLMRRSIAEHMTRSLATAAHCHTFIEVDMSRPEAARRAHGLTPLSIVARAAIDALGSHPALNAWLEGEAYTVHADVNLGVAVSLGEDGLIVPVIRNARNLSAEGLGARIHDLARRARSRELSPDEVRGATFTITNLGSYGTFMSTPIINQPQVAILDLEAIARRPVVVGEGIAIRPMTVLGMGWDHRALDGALAAQFLATLKDRLEDWH
jgi:2-oxoglutarate dehydrogenase E2 component (dihydrolipoamide succinyltransferase)